MMKASADFIDLFIRYSYANMSYCLYFGIRIDIKGINDKYVIYTYKDKTVCNEEVKYTNDYDFWNILFTRFMDDDMYIKMQKFMVETI